MHSDTHVSMRLTPNNTPPQNTYAVLSVRPRAATPAPEANVWETPGAPLRASRLLLWMFLVPDLQLTAMIQRQAGGTGRAGRAACDAPP